MRQRKDEFASINKTKGKGKIVVVTVAVLAFCITGFLCARKLQLEQEYLTMEWPSKNMVQI